MCVYMCISVVYVYSIQSPQTEQTSLGPIWEGLNYYSSKIFWIIFIQTWLMRPTRKWKTCAHNPILKMNSHLWSTNSWKWTLHPKAPKTTDRSSTSPSWWLSIKKWNASMMNHHETSWMNHTSWSSSWWLWIFMILVRHDLPDSTCTSLMNRGPMLFPQMLGSPNPRNEWIAPEVAGHQQFYQTFGGWFFS